jgi:hypothetical protein
LFFRGFLVLIDESHSLFDRFTSRPGLPDGFLYFYLSFLRPTAVADVLVWRHHLFLGEIICKVLEKSSRESTCSPVLPSKFCGLLIQSLPLCPAVFRVSAVRWFVAITKVDTGKVDRAQLKDRMKQLLVSLPCDSIAFPYVFQFLMISEGKLVGAARIFDCIELHSLQAIGFIERAALKFGPLVPIIKLASFPSIKPSGTGRPFAYRAWQFLSRSRPCGRSTQTALSSSASPSATLSGCRSGGCARRSAPQRQRSVRPTACHPISLGLFGWPQSLTSQPFVNSTPF